jgi:hypothetical protein
VFFMPVMGSSVRGRFLVKVPIKDSSIIIELGVMDVWRGNKVSPRVERIRRMNTVWGGERRRRRRRVATPITLPRPTLTGYSRL